MSKDHVVFRQRAAGRGRFRALRFRELDLTGICPVDRAKRSTGQTWKGVDWNCGGVTNLKRGKAEGQGNSHVGRRRFWWVKAWAGAGVLVGCASANRRETTLNLEQYQQAVGALPFGKRVPVGHLSASLRRDTRAFFGNYTRALEKGLELLYAAGDVGEIELACEDLKLGWQDEQALYVHWSLLEQLPPVLRAYVGAATTLFGDVHLASARAGSGEGAEALHRPKAFSLFSCHLEETRLADPHPHLLDAGRSDRARNRRGPA
jgi:hypothetical protein